MAPSKPKAKPKPEPAPKKPASPQTAAESFAAIEPELASVDPARYAVINVDIPQSVSIVLGALPGVMALREAIMKELPLFPIVLLDMLRQYALGAWYAHLLALPPSGPDNPVKPLLDEADPLRANLLGDAEALARRGLLPEETVKEIRAGHGNVDTANDLVALSALFTRYWEAIKNRTAATEEEVRRAGELGPLLLAALGVRDHGVVIAPADAAERRVRAFTLFVHAYDEVRRAVYYLRWHDDDADTLAPSLYKGRGGRGAARTPEDTGEGEGGGDEGVTPVAPVAASGG